MKRRIQKRYRIEAMDTKIRAQRSKNEARIIAVASKAGINAPKLLLFDKYDIYMTEVKGKKLTDGSVPGSFEGALRKDRRNAGTAA